MERANAAATSESDADKQRVLDVLAASNKLLVDAHREMYCSRNARKGGAVENATTAASLSNFDLGPSADDEKVICGAPFRPTAAATPLSTIHDEADSVLDEWRQYTVDWVATKTSDDFTPLLIVRHNGVVCWSVEAVCEHVDILRWFREVGSVRFPSIAALARIWLGRAPSNEFQERVFSTGGIVMSNRRTRTDTHRAVMQVLRKHNRKEILCMEANDSGSSMLD
ncbi:hypothetical protein PHYSODRAFT_304927 [Phytophthora sojae]|uniref:HAT C-terminal dimerisation domain-containing protein n=1 Tax=Phytophthora sojae (strain P6497) TaxID=1094619 RepID=G5A3C7_PHYSP|nr:hypothetical protein PHYSODRAFT_304927 [Phytophthora sojae]EGZ09352.1 hypothetical protein PHYSODRAFT_304927 [Phytophthora sojae]|eukprot:XP_009534213.1 hypothetical protein PHYSODRAFT_304927 [Phytophthora sojae]